MILSGVLITTGQGWFSGGARYGFPCVAGPQSSPATFPPHPLDECLPQAGTLTWNQCSMLKGGEDGCGHVSTVTK